MEVMHYFLLLGSYPSLEIAGFCICIYISDFSILFIRILIQLTKEHVVYSAGFMITAFHICNINSNLY